MQIADQHVHHQSIGVVALVYGNQFFYLVYDSALAQLDFLHFPIR